MLTVTRRGPPADLTPAADVGRAAALLALLAVVVGARSVALQRGVVDPIVLGAGFGVALVAVAWVGWDRPRLPRASLRAIAIGIAGGLALIALAGVGLLAGDVASAPRPITDALLAPWALATLIVATGEEAVLRGAVFDRLLRASGVWPAVLVTSLAFALMHVPFYGWSVVPLDLGVGIWLAGLRLAAGGIVAPVIAHAVADLATWVL